MKFPKPAALAAAGVLTIGAVAVPVSAAVTEPAKAYGVCVHKTTGAMRVLERTNLAKSQYGKCKSTEMKVVLPSIAGLPKFSMPATIVYKRTVGTETCTKDATSTSSKAVYSCAMASPPASPPASPAN